MSLSKFWEKGREAWCTVVHGITKSRTRLSNWTKTKACLLSWWCHPAFLSSVTPFSSCPQSFQASGSFPMSRLIFTLYSWSLEKALMLGKIEGKRRRGWQKMRCSDGITDSTDMNLSKLWEMVKDREAWHAAIHGVTKSRTQMSDRTLLQQMLQQTFVDGETEA